jgi:hypothetical protein
VTADNYEIANSKAFLTRFALDIDGGSTAPFTITFPQPAPVGLTVTLEPPPFAGTPDPTPFALWPAPAAPVIRGDYQISVLQDDSLPGFIQLAVDIFNEGGSIDETWELRASVTAPIAWKLVFTDPPNTTMEFLACDPRAQLLSTPAQALEQAVLTLHSADATDGTVIGTLPVELTPTYRWRHEGNVAISTLPSPVQTEPDRDYPFPLPSVYEPLAIPFVTDVAFGGSGPNNTAFLTSTSDPAGTTVSARPQHVVLVLDRSGSMNADTPTRWSQAEVAARAFTHLFVGSRLGVHPQDSIGIVTFTEPGLWHGGAPDSQVKVILPMTLLDTAKEEIKKLDLEAPFANTPIGDGVVKGLDALAGVPGPVVDSQFTLVLLTDGIENAGTVFVGPTDPNASMGLPPGTVKPFNNLPFDPLHPRRGEVLSAIRSGERLFAVGLGSQIEATVLNTLAAGNGRFTPINSADDLAETFADILTFSQDVNRVPTAADATGGVHFSPSAGADRLIFVVMPTVFIPGSTITLERQDPADGVFKPFPITVESTATHHAAWVSDKAPLEDGTAWRVTYRDGVNPVALTAGEVLAFEDLHVKADVLLDKEEYLTGDDMRLTVRLRHDAAPILNARVRAELEAPTVGLGTALSGLGPNFQVKSTGHIDDLTPLGVMIGEVLRRNKWRHLPCEEPPKGLFEDGTDLLHDRDGDGNYTNAFVRVHKEGAFRWTLFAEGVDTKGHRFNRQLSISALAGIQVDAEETDVDLDHVKSHPSGMRAVRVTVKPQDARGELLGPNKDRVVVWALDDGVFEHVWNKEPAPVLTDGAYQRVVLFRPNQRPRLRVKASGTVLRRIRIR